MALVAETRLPDSRAMSRLPILMLLLAALLTQPVYARDRVTVFAAASMGSVLQEIAQDFEGDVVFSFGGSGALARQVAAGAPADLVVLASTQWADWLRHQDVPVTGFAASVAGNRMAMIVPTGQAAGVGEAPLLDILDGGRLAMGHREAVPAGIYARQWLQAIGSWPDVVAHLAETDDVRAALALVAWGEAPLGIVYVSDAQAEPRVEILRVSTPQSHDPIRYPAIALTDAGRAFLDHLSQPAARAILAAHGFEAPGS